MHRRARFLLLVLTVSVFVLPVSGTWTVYRGDTFTIEGANASLEWGQNYTFNATGFTEYTDTLHLNMTAPVADRNITLSSNTSAQLNATLWEYNLSRPSLGQELVRIETTALPGTSVTYRFTGIPAISSDRYVVKRDGATIKTRSNGGTITWRNEKWSARNFTVTYEQTPQPTPDAEDSGDGSIPLPKRFAFTDLPAPLTQVELRTTHGDFGVDVSADVVDGVNVTPPNGTVYRYIFLTVDGVQPEEVANVSIAFTVVQTFAEQFEDIQLQRYNAGWMPLATRRTKMTGDRVQYVAMTPEVSLYAITGHGSLENASAADGGQQGDTGNVSTGAICGNGKCESGEDVATCPADCEEPGRTRDLGTENEQSNGFPVVVGIIALIAAAVSGFVGYRYWQRHRIKQDLARLTAQVDDHVNQSWDPKLDSKLVTALSAAETAFDNGKLRTAQKHITELERLLESPPT